ARPDRLTPGQRAWGPRLARRAGACRRRTRDARRARGRPRGASPAWPRRSRVVVACPHLVAPRLTSASAHSLIPAKSDQAQHHNAPQGGPAMRLSRITVLAVALLGVLYLAGADAQQCPKGKLRLYTSWQMQGAMIPEGTGMKNGVDLAVSEGGGGVAGPCLGAAK